MPKSLDIAIAGAGPAGLAAALSLHRDGHRVRIFERFETAHPIGSGLILQPTGQAVMAELGLWEAMRALGQPLDRLIGHDARSGRVVLDMRYAALPRLGRGLGIHRASLTPLYQSDSRWLPVLRDVLVPIATKVPPLPQFLAALVAGKLLSPMRRLELQPVRL